MFHQEASVETIKIIRTKIFETKQHGTSGVWQKKRKNILRNSRENVDVLGIGETRKKGLEELEIGSLYEHGRT